MSDPRYQIDVSVVTRFLADQSQPEQNRFAFAYTITVKNNGLVPAKLLSRHWVITDGFGVTREVRGDGVVGLQPIVAPGESFEYSSTCPLSTPYGSMHGEYYCVDGDGGQFIADIPQFLLLAENVVH